jgi:hypothetical protein
MSAPAAVIWLEVEEQPKVFMDCMNEGEYERLRDWLDSHPELHALLAYVRELQEKAKAA